MDGSALLRKGKVRTRVSHARCLSRFASPLGQHRPGLAPNARWKTATLGQPGPSSPWLRSNIFPYRSLHFFRNSEPLQTSLCPLPVVGRRRTPDQSPRTPLTESSLEPFHGTFCIKGTTTPRCGTPVGLVSPENTTRPIVGPLLIFWSKSRVGNDQCTSRKRGFAGIKLSYVHLVIRGVYLKVLAFASGPKNRLIVVVGTHFPEWIRVTHTQRYSRVSRDISRLLMGTLTGLTKYTSMSKCVVRHGRPVPIPPSPSLSATPEIAGHHQVTEVKDTNHFPHAAENLGGYSGSRTLFPFDVNSFCRQVGETVSNESLKCRTSSRLAERTVRQLRTIF